MADNLSYCAEEARRQDWDRFMCTLFAPQDRRESLFALLAFNQEVAKTRETVSEPILGEIRLQWWRDAIERIFDDTKDANPAGHHVLDSLTDAIHRYDLSRDYFDRLIDGRAQDLDPEPIADTEQLSAYADATSASLNLLMLEVLGLSADETSEEERIVVSETARDIGIAWSIIGQIRALPGRMPAGPPSIPKDLLVQADLDPRGGWEAGAGPQLAGPIASMAELGRARIEAARKRKIARRWLSVMLPAVLAGQYLSRLKGAGHNPFHPGLEAGRPARQLRVAFSALRGVY